MDIADIRRNCHSYKRISMYTVMVVYKQTATFISNKIKQHFYISLTLLKKYNKLFIYFSDEILKLCNNKAVHKIL